MTIATGDQTSAGTAGAVPALVAEQVCKTYPGVRALSNVSISVEPGEVRGLVGENGSGKSTFVKLLSGAVAPDPGSRIEFFGEPLPFGKPVATQRRGVATVHQELVVFPLLSVMENVFVGELPTTGPLISRRQMLREFGELCARLDLRFNPDTIAGELSVADQTMIELLRATRRKARLLLLDEPTASLGPVERERLYSLIDRLRRDWGLTIVYVSHDLDEVLRLTTSITVFRDGEHIASAPASEWTKRSMVAAMLGENRTLERVLADQNASRRTGAGAQVGKRPKSRSDHTPLLEARNVQIPAVLDDVSLRVYPGEILGIAGLVGAGRSELLKALAGALRTDRAELWIRGKRVRWPRTVRQALALGIALLPEERKTEGLVLGMSAWDNVISTDLRRVAWLSLIDNRRAKQRAGGLLQSLAFRGSMNGPVRALSGGNQQKVVLAKWLHRPPAIFLLDEPTRGIDVGAKAEILQVLRQLTSEGQAIIVVSSEFEEIVAVSDRVVLLAKGRVIGELEGEGITVHNILHRLFDVEGDVPVSEGTLK
jgi:ABC-type sugar transport system ATPase subunit